MSSSANAEAIASAAPFDPRIGDLANDIAAMGQRASEAARRIATASPQDKVEALTIAADQLQSRAGEILRANDIDVQAAKLAQKTDAFIDRLTLTDARISQMADGLRIVAELDDPVGQTIAAWDRPNGLKIARVRTPIGVIGVIFESRPNVTADAGALCLKSGNAAILRGGSDSLNSSLAILDCLKAGLAKAGLPEDVVQVIPTGDREAVGHMLSGLNGTIDVIVPRGGRSLVERVQAEARVPVFAHLEGVCHTYIDAAADLEMARKIVVNAKLRRTGICGATETVLVDQRCADTHLQPIVSDLLEAGCEVRGDATTQAVDSRVIPAKDNDWGQEFLDAIIAIKVLDGVDDAIDHIAKFSSGHTEAIVTDCFGTSNLFLSRVDSAIVMHNASTQFADGGEFGMGAEIGIATGKMHARGPVGVEQLTSFKYVVRGSGQVRPV
ncbi:MAG: glutamate-5-semialdehyde dehydrogenase [Pseudomonadota bacterium]